MVYCQKLNSGPTSTIIDEKTIDHYAYNSFKTAATKAIKRADLKLYP